MNNPFRRNSQRVNKDGESRVKAATQQSTSTSALSQFFEEDEEYKAIKKMREKEKGTIASFSQHRDPIEMEIEKNHSELGKKYPGGGLKRQRIITSDILRKAPKGYFINYLKAADSYASQIRNQLADEEKSEIVARAQANPTDEAIQDEAYGVVHTMALEVIGPYRGTERKIIISLILNEILGFGVLDPLWRDDSIDEIICNGINDVQIEVRGQLHKVPACSFLSVEHMEGLIGRLYEAIGKVYSQTTPLIKGRLHDNSRIFAVHPVIAPDGPNFNIRKHPEFFWTPADIIAKNSANEEIMTDLGNLILKGASFLVIGGTSTGKTSLLNALTGFYKEDVRLLTLEDNIEMKPNPKKLLAAAMETRPSRPDKPEDEGVSMRDLVKAATQMRPDGIIVGEVTGPEALDLVNALNTGHFGASTVHANSEEEGLHRLSTLMGQTGEVIGDGTLPLIAAAFDFFIFLEHFPQDGSRRIMSISEVSPRVQRDANGNFELPLNPLWKFEPKGINKDGEIVGEYVRTGAISEERRRRRHLDLTDAMSWEELRELSSISDA